MTVLTWDTASDFNTRLLEQSVIHESRDGHSDTEISLGHRSGISTKKHIGSNAFAPSRPLGHMNRHRGVYDATSDKTFIVFSGYRGNPQAAAYDHGTGTWEGPVEISTTSLADDDHGAPAMEIDGNGTIWVAWGSHNTDQYWTQSTNVRDISAWDAEKTLTDQGYTYPQWHSMGSTMYLFVRGTNNEYGYNKTSDGGSTWNGWVKVLSNTGADVNRVYVWATYSDGTDVHWVWSYWDGNNDPVNLYYARFEISSETLYSVDGTQVSSFPVDKSTADTTFLVHDSDTNGNKANAGKLGLDGSGNPHIVFNLEDSANTTWNLNYVYWDGSSWTTPSTVVETVSQHAVPEIIVNGASDIDVFTSIASATGNIEGSLEHWHYDGSSWGKVLRVMDESDSEFTFGHPMRIDNAVSEARIAFCEINNDVFDAPYTHPFVWGDSGFLEADRGTAIAYYPMDESSGTTANDRSDAGNNATINGGITLGSSGLLGTTCFDFDGSSGYLDFSGVPIDLTKGFTAALSVNIDTYPWDRTVFFQFGDSSSNNIHLQRRASGPQLEWGYYDGSTGHHLVVGDLATGTWIRLVCVYIHRNTGRWLIYKDGVLIGETTDLDDDYIVSLASLDGGSNIIGAQDASNQFFDGKIEDFIVDQHPWTGYEVTEDYNAYVGGRYVSGKKVA